MRRSLGALSLAAALCLAPALTPSAAFAQSVVQPVTDSVSLNLSVEDWVKTETALVSLIVDVAGASANGGTVRSEILKAVAGLADKAEWRITAMDTQSDSAGLERWQAELQARLPEGQLAALGERAKKASRPGLQVRVGGVAFDPTLAELETARGALRGRLYAQVDAELKRLNAAFPGRTYRVGAIDFFEQSSPQPMMVQGSRVKAMMAEAAPMADAAPGVQDKLVLGARVTLSAFASP